MKITIACALAVALAAVAAPAADAARAKSPAVKRPATKRVATKRPRGGTFGGRAAGADWQGSRVRANLRVKADRKRIYLQLGDLPELGYVITADRVDASGNRFIQYKLPKRGTRLWSKNIRAANDERGGFARRESGLAINIASEGSLILEPSGRVTINQTATSEVSFALLRPEERKALGLPERALESSGFSFQGERTRSSNRQLTDPAKLFAPRERSQREGSPPNERFLLVLDGTPPGFLKW